MKTLVVQHQQIINSPFKQFFCLECEDPDLVEQYLEVSCFILENSQ